MKRKREEDGMSAPERLTALRSRMLELNYEAFIVPSEDAHMSEYVATCDERRAFISDFDGSAGIVVVTAKEALCWTDGRYYVQAQAQLDSTCFKMMRMHEDPPVEQWLASEMPEGAVIAVDGATISVGAFERMRSCLSLRGRPGVSLTALPDTVPNLVDEVWGAQRPPKPSSSVYEHPVKYAGQSAEEKLASVRASMRSKSVTHLIVAGLDEVAWLLNLRGSDVDYNPIFWSYVLVELDKATLYVSTNRLDSSIPGNLSAVGVALKEYDELVADLKQLPVQATVWIDPAVCNYALCQAILAAGGESKSKVSVVKSQGPVTIAKARKNEVELDGMRAAHVRDAVAMVKFLCWLEHEVVRNGNQPTECEAAAKIDGLRAEQDLYVSLSFPTISSSGSNGAIIHYRPMPESCAKIDTDHMYLVDSGAQYRDGTTDVTRTMHFGAPTDWEKECFTLVLRGHIALDKAVFPKGTTGYLLDAFARRPMWEKGLDYKHGTGHGVGCFLNVHEGPHVLSFKPAAQGTALEPGFLSSNEPGYYETKSHKGDGFGIRIENICAVVPAKPSAEIEHEEDKPYYAFEHLTLVPMQTKMMMLSQMSDEERQWVNDYNAECLRRLSPLLHDDHKTLAWLKDFTQPLPMS